ncbi:MAG: carbohydrate kinase [Bacteroidetes bacterium]|nr:MAG: carbohydrate kinase [Bacteroidota bacterium]
MKKVICFGEILWDMLPSGKVPGGAPMNVAFHLNQFGWNCKMISRVGGDPLGQELVDFLENKRIPKDFIQIDPVHPTGTVKVELDEKGIPSYEIIDQVAYDFLEVSEEINKEVAEADVFIYGSLASRNETSRKMIMDLLENTGVKIFDINLREPHYTRNTLEGLLKSADIVKMNDEELDIIASWHQDLTTLASKMKLIKSQYKLLSLIITRGKEGASVLDEEGKIHHSSHQFDIKVLDTVGCGDAFLAGYVSKMMEGATVETCLEFASGMGAYLATQRGATPFLKEENIYQFIHNARV